MLHEIDQLAGGLEGPVERPRRLVEILFDGDGVKRLESLPVSGPTRRVLTEINAHGKFVRRLSVMAGHVAVYRRGKLAGIGSKAVDNVIGTAAIGLEALTVQEIAPLHYHLRNAFVAGE